MKIKAVVFDLDGTLLDTVGGIAAAMNKVLNAAGLPPHDIVDYKGFVGDGVAKLTERVLPPEMRTLENIADYKQRYRVVYDETWLEHTCPYDGVEDMLRALRERGVILAVLSNKLHSNTVDQVDRFFPWKPFEVVLGARDGIPLKPDPQAVLEIAGLIDVTPGEFVFVGDTPVDMLTAKAAGMTGIGASWGFRTVEELRGAGASRIIDHPMDLIENLNG